MSEPVKLSPDVEVIRYENGVIEFWDIAAQIEDQVILRLNGTESDELVKWIKSLP